MKKRLLSILLSLAMIVGLVPATALAVEQPVKYVSLGDSMTNGYGLDGYTEVNGYLEEVPGSYPVVFKEMLEVATGKTVELTQLATSATRADDVLYLLKYGTEEELPGDDYTQSNIPSRMSAYYEGQGVFNPAEQLDLLAEKYQTSVKDADVISVGVGSNNFSTFLTRRLGYYVGCMAPSFGSMFGSMYDVTDLPGLLATVDPAVADMATEVQNAVYDAFVAALAEKGMDLNVVLGTDKLTGDPFTAMDFVGGMAESAAYTVASFAVSYKGIIDHIIAVNGDAEIIAVGLSNWLNGMNVQLAEDVVIPVGTILDYAYGAVNAYIAGLPAAYEYAAEINGEEPTKIYYAEVGDVQLLSEQMAATGEMPTETVRRRTVRDVTGMILPMLGDALGAYPAAVSLEDIETYEAVLAGEISFGDVNDYFIDTKGIVVDQDAIIAAVMADSTIIDKATAIEERIYAAYEAKLTPYYISCVGYLGIEKAFLNTVDLQNFPLATFMALATDGGLQEVVMNAMAGIDMSAGVTPDDLYAALVSTPALQGLCNIFAIYVAGDGVLCHPSMDGHMQVALSMMDVYENKYTAGDYTEDKAEEILNTVLDFVAENYEEIYEAAYDVAEELGYTQAAVGVLELVKQELAAIDIAALGLSEQLQAELAEQMALAAEIISDIQALVLTADQLDEATLATVNALLNDLYDAMENANDILVTVGTDIQTQIGKQLGIVDTAIQAQITEALEQIKGALEAVKNAIDEDIAPAVRAEMEALTAQIEAQIAYLEAVVNGQIDASIEEITAALKAMDEAVEALIAAAKADTKALVQAAATELKRVICETINAFETQVEKQLSIVEAAIQAKVTEVLEQVKAALEELKENIDAAVSAQIEALIAQIEAQIAYLEAVVNGQIDASIEEITAALKAMDEAVENLIDALKAEGENLAKAAAAELKRVVDEAIVAFQIESYYASHLILTKCAYKELVYLALGGATAAEGTYAEIVAEYLEAASASNVGAPTLTYAELLTYITDNAAAIAGADVITYQMDANEIVEALVNILLATATGGEYTSPDWNNYVDVEAVTTTIDEAETIAQKLQATVAQYLRDEDLEALESIENQIMVRIDAAIDEETKEQIKPYAECLVYGLVSYAVENAKAIEAIKTINPDAEIVMLGLYNTLNGVTVVMNGETIDLGELFDYVVEAVDVYNLVYAIVSDNVTIVDISDAAVDAVELNVDEIMTLYAKLQAGGLTLNEMLAIGDAIEVALANVEAAVRGTANAEGQAYIAEQIMAAVTVLDHDYIAVVTEPTCTEAGYTTYTCSICGDDYVVDGDAATGHIYDNDADAFCNVCGHERVVSGGDPIIPDPIIPDPTPVVPSEPTLSKDCDKGANCPLNAFPDLSVNEWYHNGIHYCVENKLMLGYLDGTFGANININRGQIVTILWRQAGSPAPKSECTFTDVPKDMYCYNAVAWASENGIALGYEDGTFRPGQAILRQQLVTFFYRYAKWSGADMTAENTVISAYPDAATITAYAVPAMKWAIGTGVIQGYTDNTIRPHGNASRAHAAAVIQRFCEGALK